MENGKKLSACGYDIYDTGTATPIAGKEAAMKQSFLNSLKGIPVGQAKRLVMQHGYDWEMYAHDSIRTLLAVSNTVLLWKKDGLVELATAGDPVEVEDDT